MKNQLVEQLLPLPATKGEATSYLARLDQLISAWSDDPGAGIVLGVLLGLLDIVEESYPLLPDESENQ